MAEIEYFHRWSPIIRHVAVHDLIRTKSRELKKREEERREQWEISKRRADLLCGAARERLDELATELRSELGSVLKRNRVESCESTGHNVHYFRFQVIGAAKRLNYFANIDAFHSWVHLQLETTVRSEILISFHGLGPVYRGVIAASALLFQRDPVSQEIHELQPLCDDILQISYIEDEEHLRTRFRDWLESALTMGFQLWSASL